MEIACRDTDLGSGFEETHAAAVSELVHQSGLKDGCQRCPDLRCERIAYESGYREPGQRVIDHTGCGPWSDARTMQTTKETQDQISHVHEDVPLVGTGVPARLRENTAGQHLTAQRIWTLWVLQHNKL